jgi:UDP-N-acetyl-D-glucosamine dehydrogenase
MKNSAFSEYQKKDEKIGIIGLGYVELPLAIRFSEVGFKVIGFDIDDSKVKMLNKGESYIKHINETNISEMIEQGFIATIDFAKITDVDAILICVPTPLGVHNEPDLSYVKSTLDLLKNHPREEQILILESTTYPGTTAEEIVPVIEALGFKIGENFYIGYSPEREDLGNKNFSTQTIPKVVSGHTQNCLEMVKSLYDEIVDQTVPVSSTNN